MPQRACSSFCSRTEGSGSLLALACARLIPDLFREGSQADNHPGLDDYRRRSTKSILLCHIKYRVLRFRWRPAHLEVEATMAEAADTVEGEVEEVRAEVVEGVVEEGGGGNQ